MPVIPPGVWSTLWSNQILESINSRSKLHQSRKQKHTHLSSISQSSCFSGKITFSTNSPLKNWHVPSKVTFEDARIQGNSRHLPPIVDPHHIVDPNIAAPAAKLSWNRSTLKPVWWCEWSNGWGKNLCKTRPKLVWMKNRLVKLDHFPK